MDMRKLPKIDYHEIYPLLLYCVIFTAFAIMSAVDIRDC